VTVSVRDNDTTNISGGGFLDRFGFRLVVADPSIATLTSVSFVAPSGDLPETITNQTVTGSTANAVASYSVTRPAFVTATPGGGAFLATFGLTGLSTGTTLLTIEDFSLADVSNFRSSNAATVGSGETFTDRDASTLFAATNALANSTVTAVPEPASIGLAACGLAIAGLAGWRRRKTAGSED
jgi:hypothetical protein